MSLAYASGWDTATYRSAQCTLADNIKNSERTQVVQNRIKKRLNFGLWGSIQREMALLLPIATLFSSYLIVDLVHRIEATRGHLRASRPLEGRETTIGSRNTARDLPNSKLETSGDSPSQQVNQRNDTRDASKPSIDKWRGHGLEEMD